MRPNVDSVLKTDSLMKRTRKSLRSQPTRDGILQAARRLFAEKGYDRTTIRGIAAAAAIHPSMVMRYYGSKEELFAAAASFDLKLPDLSTVPQRDVGRTLVRHFLKRWESEPGDLPALLRVSVTHAHARARLMRIFQTQVVPALAAVCGKERAAVSSALLVTQTLGLALTRYVLRLPPVVNIPEDIIIERIGATLQSYMSPDDSR
jgi:AcrR family transcriptional regulator